MEVLALMAEGRSNQGIADELVITLRAEEKYVSSIFTKLDLPSTGSD
jgi:DNA-binding NarL/FixJ family response regulator